MGSRRRLERRLADAGVIPEDLDAAANATELLAEAGDDMDDCLWLWFGFGSGKNSWADNEENRRLAITGCHAIIRDLQTAVSILEHVRLEPSVPPNDGETHDRTTDPPAPGS